MEGAPREWQCAKPGLGVCERVVIQWRNRLNSFCKDIGHWTWILYQHPTEGARKESWYHKEKEQHPQNLGPGRSQWAPIESSCHQSCTPSGSSRGQPVSLSLPHTFPDSGSLSFTFRARRSGWGLSHFISLWPPVLPPSSTVKDICDYTPPVWIIQSNCTIL